MSPNSSKPGTPFRLSPGIGHTSRAPSPSRSPLPPTLRPAVSFSSIRQKGHPSSPSAKQLVSAALPPHLSVPFAAHLHAQEPSGMESSASSIMNVEVGDGILMKDAEAEVETGDGEDGAAVGHIEPPIGDEEARKNLREHLRRTLTQTREKPTHEDEAESSTTVLSSKSKGKQPMVDDEVEAPVSDPTSPRQYFVLTDAGKPVFASSPIAEDSDRLASTVGLMQALISVFIDDGDRIRYINAGRTRISFLTRSPLYYVCVSSWGEPESTMRSHLEYLHLQILSVVSGAQLRRIFERRGNFDLRRLLSGAETLLHSMLTRLQTDLAMTTSSLLCLPLDSTLRRKVGDALAPAKMKDILYVLLVARGRVITLVRPKKHSVHPSDLHILLNTIHAPAIFDSPASWLPICLPKFNPGGFLHAYVNFLRHGELVSPESTPQSSSPPAEAHDDETPTSEGVPSSGQTTPTPGGSRSGTRSPASTDAIDRRPSLDSAILAPPAKPVTDTSRLGGRIGLGLVCVSGGGGTEFERIREWCESISKNLESSGALDAIQNAVRKGATEYTVSTLAIPGLRHFVYKSRPHVQVTHPVWGDEYEDADARRRLITLYQSLHDAIHGKSGQQEILKLQYIRTETESVMGWITQPFELYISVTPNLPKSAVVGAANAVIRWVKKEEARLFLRDAPVF